MLGMGRYEDDVDTDVGIGGCEESELSDSDSDGDEQAFAVLEFAEESEQGENVEEANRFINVINYIV